ncbi:hypothetical protein [Pedobacter immunditicola]|uniref:hypothetical protein n=1 Tax=Pedobacter immunditicola TaxID=3133440 RepID=UPI0030A573F1
MTKYLLLFLLVGLSVTAMAQADSTAYQLQRNKVNALLAQRSSRFGQYQQSLNQKTGIFGMQTKKDIKNSNDILRQITLHDNKIFRELKVLMEYKEMQVQQVQNIAEINTERVERFTLAIKKLQVENKELTLRAQQAEKKLMLTYYVAAGIALIFIIVILVLAGRISKLKKVKRFS